MTRLKEVELQDQAVKFAGAYIENKFKTGKETEKSLVLNTVAHGFYMGARHLENISSRPVWKFWVKKELTPEAVEWEAVKAAEFYLKKKGFNKLDSGTKFLIKASLTVGFDKGFAWRTSYEPRSD